MNIVYAHEPALLVTKSTTTNTTSKVLWLLSRTSHPQIFRTLHPQIRLTLIRVDFQICLSSSIDLTLDTWVPSDRCTPTQSYDSELIINEALMVTNLSSWCRPWCPCWWHPMKGQWLHSPHMLCWMDSPALEPVCPEQGPISWNSSNLPLWNIHQTGYW